VDDRREALAVVEAAVQAVHLRDQAVEALEERVE
jgi:hypothetical protein